MNNPTKIITRFAPSPTGFMHIGSVRTALFAYLWVKKNNGTFILRIEDTDQERLVPGSVEHIINTLNWYGIEWDFGPGKPGPFGSCIQSERLEIYKKYALELEAKGLAYPDPYTKEEVDAFRKQADAEKRPFLYREHRPEVFQKWDGTKPLRLKVPEIKKYKWNDVVRGDLEAGEAALDDFVLIKSDGFPTYNFAHIIDDHEMGITHVFRADEFISSTPRFLSLYDALGIQHPIFATLPPILRDDRTKKLGKRDGAKDVMEYKAEGYLPEAMFNYLTLLGWHPSDDKEVMTVSELISEFTLERIQKGGAVFDTEKLNWFNKEYVARMSDAEFDEKARGFLPEWLIPKAPVIDEKTGKEESLRLETPYIRMRPIIREKISIFSDIAKLFDIGGELNFVKEIPEYKPEMLLWKKNPDREVARKHLEEVRKLISTNTAIATIEIETKGDSSTNNYMDNNFTVENIKNSIWKYAEDNGKGDVLWPLRVALTGQDKSPDPFMSAYVLGKEESLKRINAAIAKLS